MPNPKPPLSYAKSVLKNRRSAKIRSRNRNPRKSRKDFWFPMAGHKEIEVIAIDDFYPSPDIKPTPLRPVYCLKNRDQIKSAEEKEECFILEFDPYEDSDKSNVSVCDDGDDDDDLFVVSAKGQVACRDYPHSRHACANYPFESTPHDTHCKLCYCYVCDLSAPCSKWVGLGGHCHAFDNEAWNLEKIERRKQQCVVVEDIDVIQSGVELL